MLKDAANTMTAEEAEDLGRVAVGLGFEMDNRYEEFTKWHVKTFEDHITSRVTEVLPDFRHELTALTCIPWFASHYPDHDISIDYYRDGAVSVTAAQDGTGGNTMNAWHDFDGVTLPHACIEGVKAALEATK